MKKLRIAGWTLLASLLLVGTANALVLTFDELGDGGLGQIPDGYGGLDWDDFGWVDGLHAHGGNSGYNVARASGENVAFNWFARVGTVSDARFDFNGAWFTGAWRNGLQIDITGYSNSVQTYATTITVSAVEREYFSLHYLDIDELVFLAYGGVAHLPYGQDDVHFAMDDFDYQFRNVPEPGSLAILGLGLLGLTGLALGSRRRRRPTL